MKVRFLCVVGVCSQGLDHSSIGKGSQSMASASVCDGSIQGPLFISSPVDREVADEGGM